MDAQAMLEAGYKCTYPSNPPCEQSGDAHHMYVPTRGIKKLDDIPLKATCHRHSKLMQKINWGMRHETVWHTIKVLSARQMRQGTLFIPPVRADVLARIDPSKRNKVSSYRKGRR